MLSYILRRLLGVIPVMVVVGVFVFSLLHLAPGDPAAIIAGDNATEASIARIRASLGLDRPLLEQFGSWAWATFQGDLGVSMFSNVPVTELVACGGLPEKNKLLMQIYADVTGREFKISASGQTPALGSAMFGAVAAGKAAGGYDTIYQAAPIMGKLKGEIFKPNLQAKQVYDLLFAEYVALHDYFGRGQNDVMKRLKHIKVAAKK